MTGAGTVAVDAARSLAARGDLAASLALYAERHGDPIDRVYGRLFALYPETRALFLLDRNGAARGNMLANVLDVLLDLDGARDYARNMIAAEVRNHIDMGVDPATFVRFFDVLRAVVREGLGDDWTDAMSRGWDAAIGDAVAAARVADG